MLVLLVALLLIKKQTVLCKNPNTYMMLGVSLMLLIDILSIVVVQMLILSDKSTFTTQLKLKMALTYFSTFVQVCLCLVLMRILQVEYYLDKADNLAGQRVSTTSGDESFCFRQS